ncbi:mfs multidrug [Diplodia corticola]|uniref:Mfs multidrug n=1 Tax=Diplodia corticola TaxID=236234 RepID=A0A1J9R7E1_9PEZI|nr:mfs multidrug [Diplodia corticola]OJD36441.1 mfs multidrug [Diplodia corticola]
MIQVNNHSNPSFLRPQPWSESVASAISTQPAQSIPASVELLVPGQRDRRQKDLPPVEAVDWEKPYDPANPMDWGSRRKWTYVALISAVTFNTSLATTIFAPGVPELMSDFGSSSTILSSFVVSVYVVAFIFGPLVFAPVSELYGRCVLLNVTNVLFLAFTVGCAVSTNMAMFIVFRFFQGLWGCVPLTLGGGIIADVIPPARRANALSGWQLGPLLGPVIGPIAGGYLSESLGWRWSFWIVTIIEGVLVVLSIAILRETYGPTLLARKAAALRKSTGNPGYRSKYDDPGRKPSQVFARAVLRPFKMLFLSPIVIILALMVSIVYGYLYLLFTTFTTVFEGTYGFSAGAAGLAYLGLGVGFMTGLLFTGVVSDRLALRMAARAGGDQELKPEYRLPPLVLGAFSVPVGLFWYGWACEARTHWIVPIIGTFFIGFGVLCIYMPVQAYLIDAFTIYAASASATNTVVRSLFGAFLPFAGPSLYDALGLGWGNSLLAFVALATAPGPFLLLKYGERIRLSPRFKLNL